MPMDLITKDLLPPWMSFYEHKVNFNAKIDSIPKKDLTELRINKWSKEKIKYLNQYHIESRNQFTSLERDLDDIFMEMWRIEHPSDVSENEDYGSGNNDDEKEEQAQEKIQKVAQEEFQEKVQ